METSQENTPAQSQTELHSINDWVDLLCNEEMPIFSNTALSIHEILDNDRKGATELSSVILQDPNLTLKLLKICNTPHYNPSRQKIITVSRAIIIIGSEVIRELTLACSFFESVLSATNKQQASEEISQAIHAAVQAKFIAIAINDPSPEEVFIAALLNHIGDITFWCFCCEQAERILELINKDKCSHKEAEKSVLGFTLTELGTALSKAWKLGGLVEESINPGKSSKNPRVGLVLLGYEIIEALKEGVGSKKYAACIKKISMLTKQSEHATVENLKNNTFIAAEIAHQFGVTDAARLLQLLHNQPIVPEQVPPVIDKKQLQLQISQDITSIISEQFDINLLMETVLEGIHRGVGMDRSIFSMLADDKHSLKESLYLGWRKEIGGEKVVFNISETPSNLFHHALSGSQAFWAQPSLHAKLYRLHDINVIGNNECFMMPVFSKKVPIGLIYSDRGFNHQPLTKEDFDTFKYFAQLANIGLTLYRLQGK
jgi:HD-like signal output (HDOD) protein